MYNVVLGCKIVINKLDRIGVVGPDSSHLCRGKENIFGLFFFKKGFYIVLSHKIQLSVPAGDEIGVPL
jgi:hypothetical protein